MYFPRKYMDLSHENLHTWKVLLPRANGSGNLGELLSNPFIVPPEKGYTQTFIGIGTFDTEEEAEAALRYIKSKFARLMLGILKTTQDNDRNAWRMVPRQVFAKSSDIDWSQSVSEIDQQLYKKYELSDEEIEFIETHVKEMV